MKPKDRRRGKVLELFISTGDSTAPRSKHSELTLDRGGVVGDKFFNKNIERSVLVASITSYNLAQDEQIMVQRGALGENILIDISPYHLNPGDQICIADTILEVTQNCTLCQGLSEVNSKLPKLLKNDRGIFFKTVKGGKVKIGDSVTIL